MNVAIVVDVGNTRIKWGRCGAEGIGQIASLPPDDPSSWQRQLQDWQLTGPLAWAVSAVHPPRRDHLVSWLQERGDTVRLLDRSRDLPLRVLVERPDAVGVDRLLNAVAANARARPAIIIDAGTAVTVDLVDETGAFRGGAILPGLRLMAQALHDHTALLPFVEVRAAAPPLGTSTPTAIASGVYYSVCGGANLLLSLLAAHIPVAPTIFLTGGDAPLLQEHIDPRAILWPSMTLEGIRLSAEAQP